MTFTEITRRRIESYQEEEQPIDLLPEECRICLSPHFELSEDDNTIFQTCGGGRRIIRKKLDRS